MIAVMSCRLGSNQAVQFRTLRSKGKWPCGTKLQLLMDFQLPNSCGRHITAAGPVVKAMTLALE